MDQLGVTLPISNNTTYDVIGQKQIDIAACDKKQAFTLAVSSTLSDNMLLFQQIWSSSQPKSLPKEETCCPAGAKGFIKFSLAQSAKHTSHFSTLETMKDVS
jgi:hypothetical protein